MRVFICVAVLSKRPFLCSAAVHAVEIYEGSGGGDFKNGIPRMEGKTDGFWQFPSKIASKLKRCKAKSVNLDLSPELLWNRSSETCIFRAHK